MDEPSWMMKESRFVVNLNLSQVIFTPRFFYKNKLKTFSTFFFKIHFSNYI